MNRKRGRPCIEQEIRDAQAAKVNRTWLEPCEVGNVAKLCQCNVCGNITKVTPYVIKKGYACKLCSSKENGRRQAYSQEYWNNLAAQIDMKWLDAIEREKDSYRIQCLNCDHVWTMRPNSLKYQVKMGKKSLRLNHDIPWCPECEKKYRDENLSTFQGKLKHGAGGYQIRKCRCSICTEAKRQQAARYLNRKKSNNS